MADSRGLVPAPLERVLRLRVAQMSAVAVWCSCSEAAVISDPAAMVASVIAPIAPADGRSIV